MVRQPRKRQRETAVGYSSKDVCFLAEGKEICQEFCLAHVRGEYLRLVNTMVSIAYCKHIYFVKAPSFVPMLVRVLREEGTETVACRAAICSLQRLSLVSKAQAKMVELDVIEVVLGLVEQHADRLSGFFIGYSTALLCNLIMNARFKDHFIRCRGSLLRVSRTLLTRNLRESSREYGYLIGVIYIAIGWPEIREEFVRQGFPAQVKGLYEDMLGASEGN